MSSGLVSQSEVDSFQSCQRKHYYSFGEGIRKNSFGPGLTRGIVGHAGFTAYYKTLIETQSTTAATNAMRQAIADMAAEANPDFETLNFIYKRLNGYALHYEREFEEWEPLICEEAFQYGNFPFKPDLVQRERKTGRVVLFDHKWLYRTYTQENANMFPQLAKYMRALRRLNLPVDECCYNIVITDPRSKNPYQRLFFKPTEKRMDAFEREQSQVADQINFLKSLGLEKWEASIKRNSSSFTCPMCQFKSICSTDLDGKPGRNLLLASEYRQNDYRYYGEETE